MKTKIISFDFFSAAFTTARLLTDLEKAWLLHDFTQKLNLLERIQSGEPLATKTEFIAAMRYTNVPIVRNVAPDIVKKLLGRFLMRAEAVGRDRSPTLEPIRAEKMRSVCLGETEKIVGWLAELWGDDYFHKFRVLENMHRNGISDGYINPLSWLVQSWACGHGIGLFVSLAGLRSTIQDAIRVRDKLNREYVTVARIPVDAAFVVRDLLGSGYDLAWENEILVPYFLPSPLVVFQGRADDFWNSVNDQGLSRVAEKIRQGTFDGVKKVTTTA